MSYGDDFDDTRGRGVPAQSSQTRTRLPEEPGSRQQAASPARTVATILGVVVLLITALAFANQGGRDEPSGEAAGGAAPPTAPSGRRPVTGEASGVIGVAAGFARTGQGAQSAAANYAVALGGAGMFRQESRHAIVDAVYEPERAAALKPGLDAAYSGEHLGRLGLDAEGEAPPGMTFVSRTIPVGTTVVSFTDSAATVEVWYTALIGMAGEESTDPVRTDWKTWTFDLVWSQDDWKVAGDAQADGPAPVPGDIRASSADEIATAVEQYGGFTYAR